MSDTVYPSPNKEAITSYNKRAARMGCLSVWAIRQLKLMKSIMNEKIPGLKP